MSVLTTSIQHNFYPTHEVLAKVIQQEKEIKSTRMEKEEVKLSLFAHDMILFVENPKESIKKKKPKKKKKPLLPEPINDFCKVTGFKINTKLHKTEPYSFYTAAMNNLKMKLRKNNFI